MDNDEIILTIGIPTYNRCDLLKLFLPILLNEASKFQTQVEVIVSDNCSNDDTKIIIFELMGKYQFVYYRHDENTGPIKNLLHIADNMARGRFCWIMGDDDIIVPGAIGKILSIINNNQNLSYIFVSATHLNLSDINLNQIIDQMGQGELLNFELITPLLHQLPGVSAGLESSKVMPFSELIDPDVRFDYLGFISNSVFLTELWRSVDKKNISSEAFERWQSTYPHLYVFGKAFIGEKAYYHKECLIVCGDGRRDWIDNNFWNGILPVIYLRYFDEIIDHYRVCGLSGKKLEKCRRAQAKIYGEKLIEFIEHFYVRKTKIPGGKNIGLRRCLKYMRYNEFWRSLRSSLYFHMRRPEEGRRVKSIVSWCIAKLLHVIPNNFFCGRRFSRVLYRLFPRAAYLLWIDRYDTLTEKDRHLIRDHISQLSYNPLISILMPVYNTPEQWLRKSIQSVKNQRYLNWELCIADDASSSPHVRLILEEARQSDSRIKVTLRSSNGHISAATNSALDLANGEFIALLDHDDELAEHALYHVVVALNQQPGIDLLYSDEDIIDARGQRHRHYFKPDWNPDLFLSQNMISHLGVYRTKIARSIKGFRIGFEGSQDWDFALRFIDQIESNRIHHIPHILYHWRAVAGSASITISNKNYAVSASAHALKDFWQRKAKQVNVQHIELGFFKTSIALLEPLPLVSIIILTKNRLDLLRPCLNGIINDTNYQKLEVLVVDNGSDDPEVISYLAELEAKQSILWLKYPAPFNFSAMNNWAVSQASGEVICLLNNNVKPIRPCWLQEMVSHAIRKEIGVVGAMLYYPNDTIQHAGVLLDGVAGRHLYITNKKGSIGYGYRAGLVQNLSAVTGACLVVKKAIWEEVDGMDEIHLPIAFNDVDFCLRVQEKGYRNLWTPFAELYHHESASRGLEDTPEKQARFWSEVAFLQTKWKDLIACDPAWNPNLALDGIQIKLANPPRILKPWLPRKDKNS
jgi:glycosyltransferase involved in cell wall biosynthesis